MVVKQIQNAITDSINMEDKSTHTDKIFNSCAVIFACSSTALLIGCLVTYIINAPIGLLVWQYLFYPMLICNIVAIYLSIAQMLRNRYFSVVISSSISILTLLATIVVIILQAVLLKKVFIVPFVFF